MQDMTECSARVWTYEIDPDGHHCNQKHQGRG